MNNDVSLVDELAQRMWSRSQSTGNPNYSSAAIPEYECYTPWEPQPMHPLNMIHEQTPRRYRRAAANFILAQREWAHMLLEM